MRNDLRICAIVLAAGSSKRMGSTNKLLMEVDGVPMLKRSIQPIVDAKLERVMVVTGFEQAKVQSCLSEYELQFVFNDGFEDGMGTSLALGVESISEVKPEGIMISLGDLPYLKKESVLAVTEAFQSLGGEKIVVPVHKGEQGHPIIFPIRYAKDLKMLKGDSGAKQLIRREEGSVEKTELNDLGIVRDVDSPDQKV